MAHGVHCAARSEVRMAHSRPKPPRRRPRGAASGRFSSHADPRRQSRFAAADIRGGNTQDAVKEVGRTLAQLHELVERLPQRRGGNDDVE